MKLNDTESTSHFGSHNHLLNVSFRWNKLTNISVREPESPEPSSPDVVVNVIDAASIVVAPVVKAVMTDVVSGVMVSVSCLAFPPVDLVVAVSDTRVLDLIVDETANINSTFCPRVVISGFT